MSDPLGNALDVDFLDDDAADQLLLTGNFGCRFGCFENIFGQKCNIDYRNRFKNKNVNWSQTKMILLELRWHFFFCVFFGVTGPAAATARGTGLHESGHKIKSFDSNLKAGNKLRMDLIDASRLSGYIISFSRTHWGYRGWRPAATETRCFSREQHLLLSLLFIRFKQI